MMIRAIYLLAKAGFTTQNVNGNIRNYVGGEKQSINQKGETMGKEITLGEPLGYANLGGGAAEEKFHDALKQVLDNILDPNTRPTTAREIILRVKIKPTEERTDADVLIACDTKLATTKAFPTKVFLGRDVQGHPEAHEVNANQYNLFPKEKGNVTSMAAAAGKEE